MSAAAELIAKAQAKREARTDPKLHTHAAPDGYELRGVSTLLGPEGDVRGTWVKTAKIGEDRPAAILDAFTLAVASREIPVRQRVPVSRKNLPLNDDLLAVYPMGDPHLGMLAWSDEVGEDFDLKIAERHLYSAVDHLVGLAPASRRALIINAGDFFHSDNSSNRTARSGNALDVDSRWSKILGLGVSLMCRCIDRALEKHEEVEVITEIGNHDDHTAIMLAVCLAHHYRDNPRVHINKSPAKFHWYEFGLNLIGTTHGDTVKPQDLPGIMAADMPEAWGRTKFRHWYCGHIHHIQIKEYAGCVVESLRTLAGRDAWHHAAGYRAGRSMFCDVWHRTRGPIMRHTVGVEALA